jgi:hypothetical protein
VGAPFGYGLTKWTFALYSPGSSGYYTIARREIRDSRAFLAGYPAWLREQEVPRHGAHPPGLYLVARGMLDVMEAHPEVAKVIVADLPESVSAGFRELDASLPRADRAALATTGALTMLLCAATVLPLYLLARADAPAPRAWASAALWPVVPSAILFQPVADTAFPLLSTTALALAAWSGGGRCRPGLAALAGAGLGIGMWFTLAFLPIGLTVGLVLATSSGQSWRGRGRLILATGAGFVILTLASWAVSGANPFAIWWWNVHHHARFYRAFSRTYLKWVLVNPIELAVALGLPATIWAAFGLASRRAPRVSWAALVVLALLTLSGRNLSEIARLWLPWMPALLVASGAGLERLDAGPKSLAATILLIAAQTLLLQSAIQVVYAL